MDASAEQVTADSLQHPLSPTRDNVKPTTEAATAKPTNALTPPTSEEFNHELKAGHEDSELSELDLSDDEEEIEPDHYWGDGKVPVFKPTMEQFRSFKKFVEKIDKYGMKSGIVKVIPPKEWRDSLHSLDEMVKRIKIKNPITQEFVGTFGTYTQQNVEKQRSYNLPEWKALTEETHHQPPAKRGERRRNQEKVVRGGGNARTRAAATPTPKDSEDSGQAKKKPGRPRRSLASDQTKEKEDESSPAPSGRSKAAPESDKKEKPAKRRGRATGAGQTRSVTSRRLNNTAEAADWVDEAAFKKFDYHMDGLDEFTPERCAELETHYWKSLGFNQPMYAADMPGSLFDESTESWNVAKLENLLDVLGTKVPGVNTAYLYLGMWKATFAWHLEDVDLYSINYIHFGAPKQWYSISQEDARRFEAAMKSVWPVDSKNCDQFLRHKTYLISPDVLQKQYNVKVNKLVHYEGEFVITYPYGYHSGYNIGYNCAESVNFATESWLDYGRIARKCNCESDNVWVDVQEIERKLRGEPTPEFYEVTDDDESGLDDDDDSKLPTPPASVKGQKTQARKRKREDKKEVPKKKKKIRIRIKSSTREPCAMCPNDCPWEPLLPTDNGKMAHRSCALYTPETWIMRDIAGVERIAGVANIDRARLELKCNFCRSKRGACFQCSAKKCTRAFHATCALAAGVQVDSGPVPTFGEDGTEYFEEGYDFRCKFHRSKVPKNVNVDSLENNKRVMNYAKEVKPNDVVQAQLIGGDIFAGRVVENRSSEQTLLLDVLPEGDQIEVEWKYLAVMDPNDSQRLKPSPNAVPMPEGMNKQSVSIGNRQDGVPTQDEPFTDNSTLKWQDFNNVDMPPSGYACSKYQALPVKANLDKSEELFYYLPAKSTEARCFFTDIIGGTEHNPRSNFVERANPKPAFSYQQQKRPSLAASYPLAVPAPQRQIFSAATMAPTEGGRPYVYKPREPAQPQMFTIDHQALANQRNFTAQVGRQEGFPGHGSPPIASGTSSSHPSRSSTPLRAFPPDQYYSHNVLPAAFPGEYSGFTREVKRQSQGAQTLPKPEFCVTGQTYAPMVPMMAGGSSRPGSNAMASASSGSRPTSAAYEQHLSSHGAPLTPTTTTSSASKFGQQAQGNNQEYLDNLPKGPNDVNHDKPASRHTPSASLGSLDGNGRQVGEQWTPPSQRAGAVRHSSPNEQAPQRFPPRMQQASADFFQQMHRGPSIASRDGAHLRMLRDQGFMHPAFSGPPPPPFHRNSFSQTYENVHPWQVSPKAPIASPLSDPNTPGFATRNTHHGEHMHGVMPLTAAAPMKSTSEGMGLGPMLPQMESSGNETWRFT